MRGVFSPDLGRAVGGPPTTKTTGAPPMERCAQERKTSSHESHGTRCRAAKERVLRALSGSGLQRWIRTRLGSERIQSQLK